MRVLADAWDQLEEQLAVLVIQKEIPLNDAIKLVCRDNLGFPVKAMLLAAISFVTHIEANDVRKLKSRQKLSLERHKSVVALAADLCALSDDRETCGDLLDLWKLTEDLYFSS